MNSITIHGRLTKDPEITIISTGSKVCKISVAVNRRFKPEETDFFDCTAWNKTADFIEQYFRKGREILVRGQMQSRVWEDSNGNKRKAWEINIDEIDFCGKPDNDIKPLEPSGAPTQSTEQNSEESASFTPLSDDDDLPF